MYPIKLDATFDSSKLKIRRKDRLSDIVRDVESNIRARFQASNVPDRDVAKRLIEDFCGIYISLDDRITQLEVTRDEGRDKLRLSKIFSLYVASVAATNKLFDSNIESILQAQEDIKYSQLVRENDFKDSSNYALLGKLLEKIKSLPKGRTPQTEKFHLYHLFDTIRAFALGEIYANCSPNTRQILLSQIQISLKDMDFVDYSTKRRAKKNGNGKQQKPADDKETKAELEKLPDTVPAYVPIYPEANLKEVVGNVEGMKTLLTSLNQAIDYDPVKRINPWAGFGYHELILLHGIQGTGKNFTVDAVLNAGKQIARDYGVEIEYVNFKKELRSIYKDRVPQLLAHFVDLELKANKVYVNVLNEADGLFGVGNDGLSATEVNKLISDAKEVMDYTMGKGIVWWLLTNNPSVFEAAMGDRLLSETMNGAQTPEEYCRLFYIKLGKAREAGKYALTPKQLSQAVEYFMQRKQSVLDDHGIVVSGRAATTICEKFASFDKTQYLQKGAAAIHRTSSELKRSKIYESMPQVTYQRIIQAIDSVLTELVRRKLTNETYAKQHRGKR